jgi:hypothetical protein
MCNLKDVKSLQHLEDAFQPSKDCNTMSTKIDEWWRKVEEKIAAVPKFHIFL